MSIDSRVVDLKFNYSSFSAGVKNVLGGLAQLSKGLKMDGASKGLDDVQKSASRFSLSGITNGVQQASQSFSVLSGAATVAFGNILSQAISTGAGVANSFTAGPIIQGFQEYETKMKSIQTILANTARHGTGLETVNAELENLNKYADQTIYSFSEMTKNASLFTNSGMKIEDATQVIKGFSNMAAASGTGATEAAGAAFQLSQAFNTGKIAAIDWISLTNRGMGNKNTTDSLIQIATAMGTLEEGTKLSEKAQKDFKGSLQDGWLTTEVFTTYLQAMTGDMTDAELAAKGLSTEQIKGLQAQAKTALEAATKIRTFTQLMGTAKEAIASGWTSTFEILFGNFTEATDLFTMAGGAMQKFVEGSAHARNKVLGDWKALGGRTVLIEGIKNAFQALVGIVKPISAAFRQIFPKNTGADLFAMTQSFTAFTERLKMGAETTERVKRIFAGFFAGFSILGQILGGAIGLIGRFFAALSGAGAGSGFLSLGSDIGMFVVNLDLMLRKSGLVKTFFDGLGDVLAIPLKALALVGKALATLFDGFQGGGAEKIGAALDSVGKRLDPLQRLAAKVRSMFDGLIEIFSKVGTAIGKAMSGIGEAIAKAFSGDQFSQVLDTVNTGLLAALVLMLRKFFNGGGLSIDLGDGVFDSVKEALGSVTEAAKSMQTQIKADILIKIAIAIGILAASLLVLSTIDSDKLTKALIGVGVGFGFLQLTLIALSKALMLVNPLKLIAMGMAMGAMAKAILLMAVAIKILSTIPTADMIKAILGMAASLVVLGLAMKLMPAKAMISQGLGIGILALALMGLAVALKVFATIPWDDMGKGLVGIGGALVVVALGMRMMPKSLLITAAGLVAVGVALNIIAVSMKIFASMSLQEIGLGLLAMAGGLLIIAAAMTAMPPTMILLGPALLVVAAAITVLAGALQIMGGQNIAEMAIGLGTLAGSLTILAIGLTAMSGALPGAAALLVAAGALAVLTPVLITLGTLSIGTIVTGLAAMAGVFLVLGAAGFILAPIVPVILGLAAAMVLIGAGMALAGIGIAAFAAALATAVALGAAGIQIISRVIGEFVKGIPGMFAALGKGIVAFVGVIAKSGKAFVGAFSTILSSILQAITNNIPKIGAVFSRLIDTALRIITVSVPRIANAGLQLIIRMLAVMSANVGRIVTVATSLIVNFMNGLSANMPRLVAAGVNLIITFINTLANTIRNQGPALGAAGVNLATAIVQGMARGIAGGIGIVTNAAKNLARNALNAAKGVLGIKSPSKEFEKVGKFVNEGFVKGLNGNKEAVGAAWKEMWDLLVAARTNADEDIREQDKKLRDLLAARAANNAKRAASLAAARKKDAAAVKAVTAANTLAAKKENAAILSTQQALAQAKKERVGSHNAMVIHGAQIMKQRNQLEELAEQQDKNTESLKEANKTLEDAIKTRDDYNNSLSQKLGAVPDISKDTKLTDYLDGLREKIIDTQKFASMVQELRKMGLSDEIYKALLDKGPEALPFISELLQNGKTGVTAINNLQGQLISASQGLGKAASASLYQAGVDAAQGVVNGLKAKETAIAKQMEQIAAQMISALKKKLGIKSPSKEFAKLGKFSTEGLALGLKQTSAITAAADQVGNDALNALKNSMAGLADEMAMEMDLHPTITPVLDLSDVKKGALTLGSMLPNGAISVQGAYSRASEASRGYSDNFSSRGDVVQVPVEQHHFEYTQINNSPKALSSATIYRQTRNQLSTVKGGLNA